MANKFSWSDQSEFTPQPQAASKTKFSWDNQEEFKPNPEGPSLARQVTRGLVDSLPMVGGLVGGIVGTPADGFYFHGPFDTSDDAIQWAEKRIKTDAWSISELTEPD